MSIEKWIEVNNDYLWLMNDFNFVLVKFLKATYITIRKVFFLKKSRYIISICKNFKNK